MSKSMAIEPASERIRVNTICPADGATGLIEAFMGMPDTPESRKNFIATIPMRRPLTPCERARAAAFLPSQDAEFITRIEFLVEEFALSRMLARPASRMRAR